MLTRKQRHPGFNDYAGGRRADNKLATVRKKEVELTINRVVTAVESRWARRIERATPLKRIALRRLKQRAISRALEKAC